jgi:AcrR family transcriptional regulator
MTPALSIQNVYVKYRMSCERQCRHTDDVPKLWDATIESHRQAVRDATIDATAALVAEHGIGAVTMSRIAEETGIGRATLYKYFPDVESILMAWHERHIGEHLAMLTKVRDEPGTPAERLAAVLRTFAELSRRHPDTEVAALLHRGEHVKRAQQRLRGLLRDLIAEGAQAGELRSDVPADELAAYALHAVTAAGHLPSKAGLQRLVEVTLSGLRPAG